MGMTNYSLPVSKRAGLPDSLRSGGFEVKVLYDDGLLGSIRCTLNGRETVIELYPPFADDPSRFPAGVMHSYSISHPVRDRRFFLAIEAVLVAQGGRLDA